MAEGSLTLTTLLHDPLVQLVMRSDNVSEKDHTELLFRVKGTLEMRDRSIDTVFEVVH
ncbi:MAG TPA: hypothetical protein VFG62_22490 [Rhodopila sp.]|nr:hypothetical protein [Rhodopila sp.]